MVGQTCAARRLSPDECTGRGAAGCNGGLQPRAGSGCCHRPRGACRLPYS